MDSVKKNAYKSIIFYTISFIIIINCCMVLARPSSHEQTLQDDYSEYGDIDPIDIEKVKICYKDEDTMELCQRCAKATKSSIVFPMCCANDDGVKNWCEEYVYYGIE